eukprot:scaffold8837_cov54-Attheya_sp.AAC.5
MERTPPYSDHEIVIAIIHFLRLYGVQILLVTVLSAITVFRRDLSCNRVYIDEEAERLEDIERSDSGNQQEERSMAEKNRKSLTVKPAEHLHKAVIRENKMDGDATEALLEGAGHFCSGGPLLPVVLAVWAHVVFSSSSHPSGEEGLNSVVWHAIQAWLFLHQTGDYVNGTQSCDGSGSTDDISGDATQVIEEEMHYDLLTSHNLPADVQVHILTFLQPRDLTTFACVSKSSRALVDDNIDIRIHGHDASVPRLLWKALWKRDYGWICQEWNIGKGALQRSLADDNEIRLKENEQIQPTIQPTSQTITPTLSLPVSDASLSLFWENERSHSMKIFYFTFGQTYLDYVLAGHNSVGDCLVGLHGHIFDISNFVESHPGSPETLLVHAGRDATRFFEEMGHSVGARKMARKLCVGLDRSCLGGNASSSCGLEQLPLDPESRDMEHLLPMQRSKTRRSANLCSIRRKYDDGLSQQRLQVDQWMSRQTRFNILGNIHVYYDPFSRRYKSWYTDYEFQTVFVDRVLGA